MSAKVECDGADVDTIPSHGGWTIVKALDAHILARIAYTGDDADPPKVSVTNEGGTLQLPLPRVNQPVIVIVKEDVVVFRESIWVQPHEISITRVEEPFVSSG